MIIDLQKELTPKYRFTKETVSVINENNQIKEHVLIVIKDCETERIKVHPISEFLNKWRNNTLNTVLKKANEIIPFLNYVLIDYYKKYGLQSLWDIEFDHGVNYLNGLGMSKTRSTVTSAENTLTQFYHFLAKKRLLNKISLNDFRFFENKKSNGFVNFTLESPFDGVEYPSKGREKDILHHLPNELILPFIETAIKKAPRIALGIYFQCFGGLRVGEVVNITKGSITCQGSYGENGMVINLKNRNLRPDLNNNDGKGSVKVPRYQNILPCYGLLANLYKSHINKYQSNETDALFLTKDDLAMTERSYRYYFERVKEEFIKLLEESDDLKLKSYGVSLRQKKWSTHIGRGIFSNMVADVADNATQIALARGDKSLDSALTYISDCSKLGKKVEENLSRMYADVVKKTISD